MVPIAMTGGSTGSAEVAVDTVYATSNRTSGAARYVEPGVEVCMVPEIGDYIQAAPLRSQTRWRRPARPVRGRSEGARP